MKITLDKTDLDSAVDVAVSILKSGGVLIYPTDTLYGLGGDGTSKSVVERIHTIKGIREMRPMSVMMDNLMMEEYCELTENDREIIKKHLPGPYTFLLKLRKPIAASPNDKLGVRIPDSEFCQLLCKKFGTPIISTSANLTAKEPPTSLDEIAAVVTNAADLLIDGGKTKYGGPSSIIDLVEGKTLHRDKTVR